MSRQRTRKELELQLARANRIISWMAPYIGSMCPPPAGIFDLNEHAFENHDVRLAKPQADDRPISQWPWVGALPLARRPS